MLNTTDKHLPVLGFRKSKFCKDCGDCCKNVPGAYFPDDFKSLEPNHLAQMMIKKRLAVDWWEGDPVEGREKLGWAYFLRPPTINPKYKDSPRDPTWGGVCSNLTNTGCSLPFRKRPAGCRFLKPKRDRNCDYEKDKWNKKDSCIAWIPYTDVIEKALKIAEKSM